MSVGWVQTNPQGVAYWYDDGTWTEISPADPEIRRINDMKFRGGEAYAVAEKVDGNGVRQGIIMRSVSPGGIFGQFAPLPQQPVAVACAVGADLGGRIPIMNRMAVDPTNGDLWIGGECGRVWQLTSSGVWNIHKSQSDSHIQSMNFIPNGYLYLGMSRQSNTQQAIVRWHP